MIKKKPLRPDENENNKKLDTIFNDAISHCEALHNDLTAYVVRMDKLIEQSKSYHKTFDKYWNELNIKEQMPRSAEFKMVKRRSRKLGHGEKEKWNSKMHQLFYIIYEPGKHKLQSRHRLLRAQLQHKALYVMAMLRNGGSGNPAASELAADSGTIIKLVRKRLNYLQLCTLILRRFQGEFGGKEK
jgi:hypothetical protein